MRRRIGGKKKTDDRESILARRLYRKGRSVSSRGAQCVSRQGKGHPNAFRIGEDCRAYGLVTCYTVFVFDLATRLVQILGSTRRPDARFMLQMARTLVFADEGLLAHHRVLV
jgi:hypothetical protein